MQQSTANFLASAKGATDAIAKVDTAMQRVAEAPSPDLSGVPNLSGVAHDIAAAKALPSQWTGTVRPGLVNALKAVQTYTKSFDAGYPALVAFVQGHETSELETKLSDLANALLNLNTQLATANDKLAALRTAASSSDSRMSTDQQTVNIVLQSMMRQAAGDRQKIGALESQIRAMESDPLYYLIKAIMNAISGDKSEIQQLQDEMGQLDRLQEPISEAEQALQDVRGLHGSLAVAAGYAQQLHQDSGEVYNNLKTAVGQVSNSGSSGYAVLVLAELKTSKDYVDQLDTLISSFLS